MATKSKAPAKGAKKKAAASKSKADSKVDTGSELQTLLEDQLKDIYWAEKALTKAIPKMIKKATSEELIEALENHLEETENQVEKVEQVFEILGMKAQAKKCEAMDGLIKEAEELMQDNEGITRDAAIIAAAQKVEHYEIASYGTMCTWAQILGFDEAVELLEEILEEEKGADEKLTEVAESAVNIEAASESEDGEDDEGEEDEDSEEEEDEN
ncbi:MAG: ferritin-like domain-containing protein [Chitinophagales bacterium]